ncbi:MAG: excalibur calcium-binding domain-containing protein [Brooklawnia sp.]|uniref:excalibur calcium-binding domain-containing protein n=1 Tax=Brooklawnia sp. TaxID=2699740 RepID=UPI003C7087D0
MIGLKTLALFGSVTVLGGGAVVGGAAAVANARADTVVTAVVDGDTIDVMKNGRQKRVRLLNVDTPETVDPDQPVECLGPEAAYFLDRLLPVGTVVELQYDEERTDQYGRELAGVFVEDVLVNAEIARAGLGAAVLFEPNDRFYADVLEAQNEATAAGRGLFDPDAECTIPAKVDQFSQQAGQLLAKSPTDSRDLPTLRSYLAEIAALVAVGESLSRLVDDDSGTLLAVIHHNDRSTINSLNRMQTRLETEHKRVQRGIRAEERRLEAERREAERLEEERREAERVEAERLEAERREAERVEAERLEAERREAERLEAERLEAERRAAELLAAPQAAPQPAPQAAPPNVYYKNCTAARAAGAAPVYIGQPGYAPHLDRDGDGIGCE